MYNHPVIISIRILKFQVNRPLLLGMAGGGTPLKTTQQSIQKLMSHVWCKSTALGRNETPPPLLDQDLPAPNTSATDCVSAVGKVHVVSVHKHDYLLSVLSPRVYQLTDGFSEFINGLETDKVSPLIEECIAKSDKMSKVCGQR